MKGRVGQFHSGPADAMVSRDHAKGSKTSARSHDSSSLSLGGRALGKSASLSSLGGMRWAAGDEDFARLSRKDIESLKMVSSSKARTIIRHVSYSVLLGEGDLHTAVPGRGRPNPVVAATSDDVPKLEQALAQGPEAAYARNVLSKRKRLMLVDLASAMSSDRASANLTDSISLNRELDREDHGNGADDSNTRCLQARRSPVTPTAGRRDNELLRATTGSPSREELSSDMTKDRGTLRKHRWPSIETFDQHYTIPKELLPPTPTQLPEEQRPLPVARPTIAGIEESTSFSAQAYMWPALYQMRQQKEQSPSDQRPQSGTPANIFEAGVIYRQACMQLGISPITPRPAFGEQVEIRSEGIVATQQCFAIAEAVRACAARELRLIDAFMTDMGVARIVDAAMKSGRLQNLVIEGSCLSHRTCTTLHDCLRSRIGTSLSELTLAQCGLGGDLEETDEALPTEAAAAFARGRQLIDLCEKSIAARKTSVADAQEEDDDDVPVCPCPSTVLESPTGQESGGRCGEVDLEAVPEITLGPSLDGKEIQLGDGESESEKPEVLPLPTPMMLPLFGLFAQPTSALKRLDLSTSVLSLASAKCLAKALPSSPIEVLNLSKCSLGDEHLTALAEGVGFNRNLLELLLRGNKFSGAVNTLLDVAGRHVRLAHLDLAENELPKECIVELCSALRWSCSLVSVHLLGTGCRGPASSEIAIACLRWTVEHATDETLRDVTVPAVKKKGNKEAFGVGVELVVCRALHVRGSSSWRVVSPPQRRGSIAHSPVLQTQDSEATPTSVPQSWMPACCWICCKASMVEYRWVVPDKGEGENSGAGGARVFVRPSFANFSRIELTRQRVPGARRVQYNGFLLVPPGLHCHVFEAEVEGTNKLLHSRDETSAELSDALLSESQLEQLQALFRAHMYNGRVNMLQRITEHGFQISEQLSTDDEPLNADPWTDDPLRQRYLRQSYEADLRSWHLSELCDANEEEEVKQKLWNVYDRLYEAYAIFSGRSQWPMVRQVDVYGFFEETHLLHRGGYGPGQEAESPSGIAAPETPSAASPLAAGVASAAATPSADVAALPASAAPQLSSNSDHIAAQLNLHDVQQMIVQTIAQRRRPSSDARGRRDSLSIRAASIQQRTQEGAPIDRSQFIEVMIRAALELRGWNTSISQGIQQFADDILSCRILVPPLSPFPRGLVLQVGEVCDTLLARRRTIREAWERFGGNEQAFQRLAKLLKLCDRSFTAKHISSIFALSKRPHADVSSPSKLGAALGYDEFCEAIGRLALVWERASKPGSSSADARVWPPQPQVGCPVRERAVASRLDAFLENLSRRMRPSVRATPF
eukprot:TRINITY_DN55450_c0_g1_i1.p1 TRINITY_DN55450_c0_g1~~TRINITY_DN55450_c0_g1_i1.p1  ORF type:complete len:1333 (+),score=186.86 TRINITY_DN55450_c0_g1_i1:284-4282(+)